MGFRRLSSLLRGVAPVLLALAPAAPAGLSPLDEQEMATVTGAGLNFVWEDFRFLAQPTSYFEQVGSQAAPGSTFARGDLRWYGVAISALGSGYSWADSSGTMTGCASQGVNCPGCPPSRAPSPCCRNSAP
jgi:hypothetical protein